MWQLFLLVVGVSSLSASLLVELPLGKVWGESRQGFHPTGTPVNWTSFAGIPFAQPPVGELRFLPPQPPNSTEQRPPVMCPQVRTRCPQVVGQELNCIKTSNLQCTMYNVQCAICDLQCALCNMCNVQTLNDDQHQGGRRHRLAGRQRRRLPAGE